MAFLFTPQLLTLIVFVVSKHGNNFGQIVVDLVALAKTQFGHGELFVYSFASLAPIFIVLTREKALQQRTPLAAYFSATAVSAAVLLMAQQPTGRLSGIPYFVVSVLIFTVTVLIVYAANVFDAYDPAVEAAKAYEGPNDGNIANLRRQVDELQEQGGGNGQ